MDWNTILFAVRWAIIALFYSVLLVLLVGVYREASLRLDQKPADGSISAGHLRVVEPGTDPNLPIGSTLNLKTITSIGADRDNDIVLQDQFVSAHHLRLRWDGISWWLEDLNSKNGTLLNHQPVLPENPVMIPKGAMITIGDMVLELAE
jgi:hypothetical protein